MRLIEIEALENGAHRNQTISHLSKVPSGWAVIPEDMVCENFPFGEVTAEYLSREVTKKVKDEEGNETEETITVVDEFMTVTSWVAGEIPEPEPMPEAEPLPEPEPTADELMDILLGVSENE